MKLMTKKLTLFIFTLSVCLISCKKENITSKINTFNDKNSSSYSDKVLKMNFEGRQYYYEVSFDAGTKKTTFAGKDAEAVVSIINKYNDEFIALFTTENEFTFFKNKNDYFSEVFKDMLTKNGNRLKSESVANSTCSIVSLQMVSITFFNDVSYGNELFSQQINNFVSPNGSIFPGTASSPNNITAPTLQWFTFYQRKNDGTDNYQATNTSVNVPGIKNANIGSAANDKISSFYTQNLVADINNPTAGYTFGNNIIAYNKVNVILFEHQNFGGRAIAYPGLLSTNDRIEESNLQQKISYFNITTGYINGQPVPITATNDWNDRVSSYQLFLSL